MARRRKQVQTDEAKMNLTPMIDMTFLLVVFFMLTIDLSTKEFVQLELPYARSGIEDKDEGPVKRLVINLLASGDVRVKNQDLKLATGNEAEQAQALEQLKLHLRNLTDDDTLRNDDRSSKIPVLIHGDREARWQYVQWIMATCADPNIAIYKIQFAVKKPIDEKDN